MKERVKRLTNKKITKLLYRGSRDGFKSSDFHSKCDGYKNTIIINGTNINNNFNNNLLTNYS